MEINDDIWNKVYKKREEIVSREIAGETILVPIKGKLADMQRIFAIDNVAEFIWQGLDGKTKTGELADRVTEAFDVDQKRARLDVGEFISELIEADLIVN